MNLTVVDLSHWNTVASFAEMKAGGIIGVIHKATEDTGYLDHTYHDREAEARAAGLGWAAYHFLKPGLAHLRLLPVRGIVPSRHVAAFNPWGTTMKKLLLAAAVSLAALASASAASINFGGFGTSGAFNNGGFAVGALGGAAAVGGTTNQTVSSGTGQAVGVGGAGVISLQPLGSLSAAGGIGAAGGTGTSTSGSGSALGGVAAGAGIAGGVAGGSTGGFGLGVGSISTSP